MYVLKHADTFVIGDAYGDILGEGDGLFRDDTRLLSCLRLTVGGQRPSMLGAGVSHDNVFFQAHMTNRPLPPVGGKPTPEGVIHLDRSRLLWGNRLYEHLALLNYADLDATVPLSIDFAADFRDMFEIRGTPRSHRGQAREPRTAGDSVVLCYQGLDGVERVTTIAFSEPPVHLTTERAEFTIRLPAGGQHDLFLEVGAQQDGVPSSTRFRAAAARARERARIMGHVGGHIRSSSHLFDEWVSRSRADLALLTTELETGPYPYAGIPWFSTPFGRDAIVTSLQTLWLSPALSRGVLTFLARHQATKTEPFQDAEPGKIMHEMRRGEMSALQEIPFGAYYGGVDTTPLFVMLAGAYARRTGDMAFVDTLWPALLAAMGWIEGSGDSNGDGFVDYARGAETGLANQGWKDSHDSIFHEDGTDPVGPIALIEVQGYVFAAFRAMAMLAGWRGDAAAAERWRAKAETLRAAVEARFWQEDMGFYAIALDGHGRPCRVRGSNVGHLLYTGLPDAERGRRVAAQLLGTPFDSGWAIRTLAMEQRRFNPMSYHNGSVWPHDTALCGAGLARYDERDGALRVLDGLFDAAVRFDMRLPELFCGFRRTAGEPPIAYPVACLPQAWAAGCPFMMLQACLGVEIDGWRREIHIQEPRLPGGVDQLTVQRLAVGESLVDLYFRRVEGRVVVFSDCHGPSVPVFSRV